MGENMKISANWAAKTDIIPLTDMSDEEIENGQLIVFVEASRLLLDEGYVLDRTLTARPRDADTPHFKGRYAKNGFEYRTIKNFEGWLVIFRYQRYRTRQVNKVKGAELEVNFVDVNPRRTTINEETKETVCELFRRGYTVPQIIHSYEVKMGLKLMTSTVRKWVQAVEREKLIIDIDILAMETGFRKNKSESSIENRIK